MISGFRYPDKPIETTPDVVKNMNPNEWIAQAKYDGWRLQAYYDGPNKVRCLTRNGNPITKIYPKFQSELGYLIQKIKVPPGTVLDCECIGPRNNLQPAIYIFDMLAWNGKWLVNEPFEKRWERCKKLKLPNGPIYLAETVENQFLDLFERLKTLWKHNVRLCEGIVLKARKGKLKLDRNNSKKSDVMFKCKFV